MRGKERGRFIRRRSRIIKCRRERGRGRRRRRRRRRRTRTVKKTVIIIGF
jgi:hypothetical protein